MMLDFLEVITKELWLKSNAFVQSQSIFIHLRYGKKTQYYYGFFLKSIDQKNSWNHLHEIFRKMENIPIS